VSVSVDFTKAERGWFDDCGCWTSTTSLLFTKVQPGTHDSMLQVVILTAEADCDDVHKV